MPTTFETDTLTIDKLKSYPQWVCGAQPGIRLSDGSIADGKEPINPKNGNNAQADNSNTWASHKQAHKRWQSEPHKLLCIGYVLTKEQGITCVDLDKCIDEDGKLKPWALAIVERLNSYTEYSPSGRGLHIWVRGTIPKNVPQDTPGIQVEMYDNNHYMTITGEHFDGTPDTIEPRNNEVRVLYTEICEAREQAKEAAKAERRKAKGQATTGTEQQQIKGTIKDTRYGLKALQDECAVLRAATEGNRNTQLNNSAFAIGQIIAHENPKKRVTRETAEQALTDAALAIGLDDDEIAKTLESGIEAGMDNPREDDEETPQGTEQQLQTTKTDNGQDDGKQAGESIYTYTPGGMYARLWNRSDKEFNQVLLSNFAARIMSAIVTDDGAEKKRTWEIEAIIRQRKTTFEVPAEKFDSLAWVAGEVGPKAYIVPGQSTRAHFCNAVKDISEPAEQYHYAHIGWQKINGVSVYLHNGGCIGLSTLSTNQDNNNIVDSISDTACEANLSDSMSTLSTLSTNIYRDIKVKLTGRLAYYSIDGCGMPVADAVRASLKVLDLASDIITMPLYASLWRSVLPRATYGAHLGGESGLGKSELLAVIMQHFGRLLSPDKLPCSWEDTENDLEMKLFQIKDALAPIDDFKPKGSQAEQSRLHAKADRVYRSVGNGSFRGRLDSNLNQRPERYPRSLVISTGEDIPKGQSLKARGVIIMMSESITTAGSPASKRLKEAQQKGRAGVYESALRGYLEWLAPQIDTIESSLQSLLEDERDSLHFQGHGRLNTNTANMLLGFKFFLQFAQDCQAITADEAQILLVRCINALRQVAENAIEENTGDKPSELYRRLLVAALQAKTAHLITLTGGNPGLAYGWKMIERPAGKDADGETILDTSYNPGGDMIGAIDGDDVYILPEPAYKAVCAMGSATGNHITTTDNTLRKFLHQDGLLASTSMHLKVKPRLTIRKQINNIWARPLHFKKSVLFDSSDDTDGNTPTTTPVNEPIYPVDKVGRVDSDSNGTALQEVLEHCPLGEENGVLSTRKVDRAIERVDRAINGTEKSTDTRQVELLLAELQVTLEKRDRTGIKKFHWRDDITEPWPRLDRDEFIARVSAAIESNDEKLINAAKVATLRTLGKYNERQGN